MTQKTPTFEEAISILEEMVRKLERGQLPLEEMVSTYEEGIKLVKTCEEKINVATGKIEALGQMLQESASGTKE